MYHGMRFGLEPRFWAAFRHVDFTLVPQEQAGLLHMTDGTVGTGREQIHIYIYQRRAKMAGIRHSRRDLGLEFQVRALEIFRVVLSSLGTGTNTSPAMAPTT